MLEIIYKWAFDLSFNDIGCTPLTSNFWAANNFKVLRLILATVKKSSIKIELGICLTSPLVNAQELSGLSATTYCHES